MPAAPVSRSKRFTFTINNPTPDDEQLLANLGADTRVQYLIVGRETGENGTPHLQCYVHFHSIMRFTQLSALVPRAHLEVSRGSPAQNKAYCSKDGDFTEYGEIPTETEQGKRTDIDVIMDWLDTFIATNDRAPTQREVALEQPTAFLRYRNFMQLAQLRAPPVVLQTGTPRDGWQSQLAEQLQNESTNDRVINFFVDAIGGSGKSWFQRWFVSTFPEKCQIIRPGRYEDMAYILDPSKSVFLFNIARGGMEYLQYRFLEDLKDRMVFSSKYESVVKTIASQVHVCVFSNEVPDETKMTADRYNIQHLMVENPNVPIHPFFQP